LAGPLERETLQGTGINARVGVMQGNRSKPR